MTKTVCKLIINSEELSNDEKLKFLSILKQNAFTKAVIDKINGIDNEIAAKLLEKEYNADYFQSYYEKNKENIKEKSLKRYYSNKDELNEKCKQRYYKKKKEIAEKMTNKE